jgi:ABC-2 type transport system ATP-binding protein
MDHGQIIAQDTPRALIQSLDQAATIRARMDRDVDLATLEQLPGVTAATVDEDQLELHTNDLAGTLAALLSLAGRLGLRLDNLATSSATLEDVFLAYTGRSLRE